MNTKALKIAGASAGVLLVGSTILSVRSSMRDKRAQAFLKLLREVIDAGNLGDLKNTAFNPHFLEVLKKKSPGIIPVLPPAKATELAGTIYKSFRWYNDDEDAIYGVFDRLKSKVMVSQVAAAYLKTYQTGLLGHLLDKLSADEFKRIKKQVKLLKEY